MVIKLVNLECLKNIKFGKNVDWSKFLVVIFFMLLLFIVIILLIVVKNRGYIFCLKDVEQLIRYFKLMLQNIIWYEDNLFIDGVLLKLKLVRYFFFLESFRMLKIVFVFLIDFLYINLRIFFIFSVLLIELMFFWRIVMI